VLETVNEGDLVWVHDYQLMLLPAMPRAAAPNLKNWIFLAYALSRQRDIPLSSAPTRGYTREDFLSVFKRKKDGLLTFF
jgi:hypothetical protein